jgi:hypothetical protein
MFVTATLQYIISDTKPEPDSDTDDTQPKSSLGHEELFEMILDEDPVPIIMSEPEASYLT